jgi:hypothetical protein
MPRKHHMDFRFKIIRILIPLLISGIFISGCISFEMVKGIEGSPVTPPGDTIHVGKTTLETVLLLLGAPDQLAEMEGKDLLVYEQALYRDNRISVGIPLGDITGPNIDLSAYGTLVRYDTLALFFSPDGILRDIVFEKGSDRSYMKTLFPEEDKK